MRKFALAIAVASTAAALAQPASAAPLYLNIDNISVALGVSHAADVIANPTYGPFQDVTIANALRNAIDAPTASAPELHDSGGNGTHVWVSGGHLELDFDFQAEYDLSALHFWNYYTEQYDVDNIAFTFYDGARNVVGTLNAMPRLGNFNGGGPILPEDYALSFPTNVRYVNAYMTGTNNQVDFNNIGFTAQLSAPIPEPATWAMMIGGFGMVGGAMRRRQRTVARA